MSYITYEVAVLDSGTKEWRLNGKRHREDGPAVEWWDGRNDWWLNGKRHREDGPAIERASYKEWWLNDKQLTEEEFNTRNETCEGKVVEIDGKRYELKEI